MNQILSIDNNMKKDKKKSKNSGPVEIHAILKFFSIAILIFGVFMIGTGSYSMYRDSQDSTSKTKPTIYVEELSEREINLQVTHDKTLAEVTYSWNNEAPIQIATSGRNVEQRIEIPTGSNILNVYASDVNGEEISYQRMYTVEGDIEINFEVDGNNIKITAEGKNELSYMTYRWDEEEETQVDIGDMTVEQSIEIPRGLHTLTVIVVDSNNQTETKEQEINGVTKPKLEVTTDGADNFVIIASDDQGLDRVEFIIYNSEGETLEKNRLRLEGRTELEYSYPLHEGENRLEVIVYNQSEVSETVRVKATKQ